MTSFSYFHYLVRPYFHSSVEEVNLKTSTNRQTNQTWISEISLNLENLILGVMRILHFLHF